MATYDFTTKVTVPEWIERIILWPVMVYRKWKYGYVFRRIRLTQGMWAIVDPEWYERLAKYKWHVQSKGKKDTGFYAVRKYRQDGKMYVEWMHKVVLPAPVGYVVDHINRDSLDNRRANLRIATQRQNSWNTEHGKNRGYSRFKGISWDGRNKKWQVVLCMDGKRMSFGSFSDEEAAAREYDRVAMEYKGEFAVLNFPQKKKNRWDEFLKYLRSLSPVKTNSQHKVVDC